MHFLLSVDDLVILLLEPVVLNGCALSFESDVESMDVASDSNNPEVEAVEL